MINRLNEFYRDLLEVSKITAWVLPAAGISPVVASFVNFNPPWPERVGLTAATCAVVLFTLIAVFQSLNSRRIKKINILFYVTLMAAVFLGGIYIVLFAFFVFQPANGEAFVKGFECTPDAALVFSNICPWLDINELRSVEYEETRLWTLKSIIVARLILIFVWFGTFISFAACLGIFVRHQAQHKKM